MAEKSMCLLGKPLITLYIFHCLGSNNILLVPSDIFTRSAWISMYKFLYDTDQSPHRILMQNFKAKYKNICATPKFSETDIVSSTGCKS